MGISPRKQTVGVNVGGVTVGGGAPIVVQSMTNTDTADIDATVKQVGQLWRIGEPDAWNDELTNDVGFQIQDLDGDGQVEVL